MGEGEGCPGMKKSKSGHPTAVVKSPHTCVLSISATSMPSESVSLFSTAGSSDASI